MFAWIAGGTIAGAIMGSFLATLVLRWPAGRTLGGRSACDSCAARLGVVDLAPVLSYLMLRRRCRHCGARIDLLHPAIELICADIGGTFLALSPGLDGAAGAVFGWILVALAALDLRHFWLPDRLTGLLAVLGVAGAFAGLYPEPLDRLIGGGIGFASLMLLATGYRALRGREGLGGGDPKLFGAIGLWLGWQPLAYVLLLASALGLAAAAAMLLRRRQIGLTTRLPFGSLLAVAAIAVWGFSRAA